MTVNHLRHTKRATMKEGARWLDSTAAYGLLHDYKTAGIERERLRRAGPRRLWESSQKAPGATFKKLPDKDKAGTHEKKAIALMWISPRDLFFFIFFFFFFFKRPVLGTSLVKLLVRCKLSLRRAVARGPAETTAAFVACLNATAARRSCPCQKARTFPVGDIRARYRDRAVVWSARHQPRARPNQDLGWHMVCWIPASLIGCLISSAITARPERQNAESAWYRAGRLGTCAKGAGIGNCSERRSTSSRAFDPHGGPGQEGQGNDVAEMPRRSRVKAR